MAIAASLANPIEIPKYGLDHRQHMEWNYEPAEPVTGIGSLLNGKWKIRFQTGQAQMICVEAKILAP